MKGLPPGTWSVLFISYRVCGYYITCGGRVQGIALCHNPIECEGWSAAGCDADDGDPLAVIGQKQSRPGVEAASVSFFTVGDFS